MIGIAFGVTSGWLGGGWGHGHDAKFNVPESDSD